MKTEAAVFSLFACALFVAGCPTVPLGGGGGEVCGNGVCGSGENVSNCPGDCGGGGGGGGSPGEVCGNGVCGSGENVSNCPGDCGGGGGGGGSPGEVCGNGVCGSGENVSNCPGDCGGGGGGGEESVFADFSQPTISGTISISPGDGFFWNDFYQVWRIESPGGGFTGSFNLSTGGSYKMVVVHTTSASSDCQGGGYSPVTIWIDGWTAQSCEDPAENNGGSHGSVTDTFGVVLSSGVNRLEWTACDLCTHYWIESIDICSPDGNPCR